jgi:hypothetical protein
MVTVEQVAAIAESLPEVTVGDRWGNRSWLVGGKVFAWVRPFSKADVKRFGADPVPDGPILAVMVEDLAEKEAVLAARHRGFFTIEHFNGFSAVLVQVRVAAPGVVREAVVDGWLAVAPAALAAELVAAEKADRRRR